MKRINLAPFQNEERALKMAQYMQGLFPFYGIPAPERKEIFRPIIKASKEWDSQLLLNEVDYYWGQAEREYHYLDRKSVV